MTQLQFLEVQEYNHKLMAQVTALEKQAFAAIGDGDSDKFSSIISEIDRLQVSYKSYNL